MPAAYSYLRFSSPQQATGDSIRRQMQARDAWLAAHPKVKLDTSLTLTDAGRSGFNRKNWDTYALAQFVEAIKTGRVAPGSYLLVENLDRLSREDAGDAMELFLGIVNRGIVIVQLSPVVMEFAKPVNSMSLMFAIVELSRGHSESAIKSERGRASWSRKQKEAAAGKIVTRRLPGWISCINGKLTLNEHVATVRRMFALTLDGEGTPTIAEKLNAERAPVMGLKTVANRGQGNVSPDKRRKHTVKWSGALVWHILRSRAAIGEYVPYRKRGIAALPAVANYFPSVVDADTFQRAQAAIKNRGRVGRGRKGKHVNLFSGLLVDARDGGSLTYWTPGVHPAVLISVNAKEGKGIPWVSFPAKLFDDAITSLMEEISAKEIEGKETASKADVLRNQRDDYSALIAKWTAQMDNPAIVDVVAAKLAELNTRQRAISNELAEAEREEATPLAEVWNDYRSLTDVLTKDNSDETRLKVRAALRRCIESVTVQIVAKTGTRTKIAAVRAQFRSGAYRNYIIIAHSASGNRREASYDAKSFASAGIGDADLRDAKQAKKLETLLVKHTTKK